MIYRIIQRAFTILSVAGALAATGALAGGCVAGTGPDDDSSEAAFTDEDVGGTETALSGATCQSKVAGKYCGNDMISGGSANTLYHCPGGQGAAAQTVAVCEAGCHVSSPGVNDYCNASGGSCQTSANCNNCVFYARCRRPSLPYGLTTFAAKKAIITTTTPVAGAVAVINTGDAIGHVAYVESVSGSTIVLSEGNWPYGACGSRTGTMQSLKIVGFFD